MKYLFIFALLIATPVMGQTYIPEDAPKDSVYVENGKHFKAGLVIESRRTIAVNGFLEAYKQFINGINTYRYAITHSTIFKPSDSDVIMTVIFRKVEKDYVVVDKVNCSDK